MTMDETPFKEVGKMERLRNSINEIRKETPIEGFTIALTNLTEFVKENDMNCPVIQFSVKERIKYLTKWVERIESRSKEIGL